MAAKKNASEKKTAKKTPSLTKNISRDIKDSTRSILWGQTAGRCEFTGCNDVLFEHHVTGATANLAQAAHIVAFSVDGPRGAEGERPEYINDLTNLMLLCPPCHKIVDDNPGKYPRNVLEEFKRDHEARIRHVTGLGPEMRSTVVQLTAQIGGQRTDIPVNDVSAAMLPLYPIDKRGHVIDLNGFNVESQHGAKLVAEKIDGEIRQLYAQGMSAEKTRHISLFGLAPMFLLTYLGTRLSNKIPVDLFQKHRDDTTEPPWRWRSSENPVEYTTHLLQEGTAPGDIAVLLNLSGTNNLSTLPDSIGSDAWVYEVTLNGQPTNPDFLRTRADLEAFRAEYRQLLAVLAHKHPKQRELHVLPAVPAPVAVAIGLDRMPKVHPNLVLYDLDRRGNEHKFQFRLRTKPDE